MFGTSTDVGIDLGTANVLIYVKGKGIVIDEPSIVTVKEKTREVISVGEESRRMLGRTPKGIITIRPLKDGVISDYDMAEQMLKHFINKAIGRTYVKPRVGICVPSGVTEVERRAVEDAARLAGARYVTTIEEPIAAAIGAGVDISRPCGNMVIDIGGGTTDIAVISLGGSVVKTSIKIAGDFFDERIISYVKKEYKVQIGLDTAERIKKEIGGVLKREKPAEITVGGRILMNEIKEKIGLPTRITLNSEEIREAIAEPIDAIIQGIKSVLEVTPPELACDISDRGILLTGGGSMLYGLDELIQKETGIMAYVAEEPLSCVANGTGKWIETNQNQK